MREGERERANKAVIFIVLQFSQSEVFPSAVVFCESWENFGLFSHATCIKEALYILFRGFADTWKNSSVT
jgi:hypothetical protein